MSDAILATKRPIFMSLCEWNGHTGNPLDWVRSLGNSWRTNGDIDPHWDSVVYEADHANMDDEGQPMAQFAGPGCGALLGGIIYRTNHGFCRCTDEVTHH
jgi:hypothetical protein